MIGIGNCGRHDDGLGWKFTELVAKHNLGKVDTEFRYQLQVEDSVLVSKYDTVIFADASHSKLKQGFEIHRCKPAAHYYYSSHMQSPETILYLTKELYNKIPKSFTIAIKGHIWGLGTSLSRVAEKNLEKAISFFEKEFFKVAT
ncbi:MAG: hydrogenase maturation protease [Chitinophagaceae bacterium]|nr:hydrogenase maturation protease [Chitinophagaceae bacterium]